MTSDPADGAVGVARAISFSGTFSAEPAPSTITSATVQLTGPVGNTLPTTLTLNGATAKLNAIAGAVPGGTTYTVKLAPSITDMQGRTLVAPYSRTFTTTAQSWNPTAADFGSLPHFTGGTFPTVAVDAAGNVFAAWSIRVTGVDTLFVARRDAQTGAWSTPLSLRTAQEPTFGIIYPPNVVTGPAGHVYLSWMERNFGTTTVQLARYTASTDSWGAPVAVNAAPSGSVDPNGFVPVVDSRGNVTALAPTSDRVYATRLDSASGTWSLPLAIEKPVTNNFIFGARLIVDGSDNVIAAWVQQEDTVGARGIFSARYDVASGTWAPAQRVMLGQPAISAHVLSMAADSGGGVTMAWSRDPGLAGSAMAEASRFDRVANAWTAPVRVDSNPTGAFGPTVAVDAAGYSTVAWMQHDGIHSARLAPGSSQWSAPRQILVGSPRSDHVPAVTVDVAGNVSVIASQNQNPIVVAIHYSASDGQWRAPVGIGNPAVGDPVFALMPVTGIDRTGNVSAVWFAWNTVNGSPSYVVMSNHFK